MSGSGENGRVLKVDIDSFLTGGSTAPAATQPDSAQVEEKETAKAAAIAIPAGQYPETREKMTGIRKAIAKAMVNSKHTAPHVTLMDEVDVTELVAHRKKFKEIAAEKDIKLTIYHML